MFGNQNEHDPKLYVLRDSPEAIFFKDTRNETFHLQTKDRNWNCTIYHNGSHWRGYASCGQSCHFNYIYSEAQCAEDVANELIEQMNRFMKTRNMTIEYKQLPW